MKRLLSLALALLLHAALFAQLPCDCDLNPNEPFVCAQDADGNTFELPNACFAECLGFTVVTEGCDGSGGGGGSDPWHGCGCEINLDEPFVCAQDADGNTVHLPNACFAECLGFTLVEDGCDGGGTDPWDDCGCEFNPEEPFVCAQDADGYVFQVPNACFAECWGLTVVEETCDMDTGFGNELDTCILAILTQEPTLLQEFLLALYNECDVPLGDCIINAPLFETDEAFLEYVMACIGGNFQDEGAGLQFFNAYLGGNTSSPTSTSEAPAVATTATLLQNPVANMLRYQMTTPSAGRTMAKVTNMGGQVLQSTSFGHQAGLNELSLDLSGLPSGLYVLSLVGDRGLVSLKFIKE